MKQLFLLIYRTELQSTNSFLISVLRPIRKLLNKWVDPVVVNAIWGQQVTHWASHTLPFEVKREPNYNQNLVHLSKAVLSHGLPPFVIDIGANIGDSAVLIKLAGNLHVLCVEGDKDYLDLLATNTQNLKNVEVEPSFIGENKGLTLVKERGTAELRPGTDTVKMVSFDELISLHPAFAQTSLLKIDTDGFDGIIIRNGLSFITKQKPIIFFEYDVRLFLLHGYNGLEILEDLKQVGYEYVIAYKNYGDFHSSLKLSDTKAVKEMDAYFTCMPGVLFADLALFSEDKKSVFEAVLAEAKATLIKL
jgi:FkbM family methyltransferase